MKLPKYKLHKAAKAATERAAARRTNKIFLKKKSDKLVFLILSGIMILFSAGYLHADEEAFSEIPEVYIVKKGDTLWGISEKFLKDPFEWPEIWKNNDYVINPDLIYPGNKLLLRKIFREALQDKEGKKEVKLKRKITKVAAKREAKPAKPEKTPVVASSIFYTAGFITREDIRIGAIIDSPLDRFTLSKGDRVYTDVGPGKNAAIGEKYLIYRMIGEVKHPVTKKDMGFLIKIIGDIEIKEFIEDMSVALITNSYEEIARGDLIAGSIDSKIPMIDTNLPPDEKDIHGYIISTRDERKGIGLRDIVYLDVGKNQGIVPGDKFIAYKSKENRSGIFDKKVVFQYPKITIGELKIISTRDETATALVTKSVREMYIGEKVEYKLPEKIK